MSEGEWAAETFKMIAGAIIVYALPFIVGVAVALEYSGEKGIHNLVGGAIGVFTFHQYLKYRDGR
jgi:phosphotransferase system  glucose/maltose/N-acetylglucosamine-specific IIC component